MIGGAAIGAASAFLDGATTANAAGAGQPAPLPVAPAHPLTLRTTINDRSMALEIDARASLLDFLHERLALTGVNHRHPHELLACLALRAAFSSIDGTAL